MRHGVCRQGMRLVLAGRPAALAPPVKVAAHDEDDKDDDKDEEDSAKGSTDDDGHQGPAVKSCRHISVVYSTMYATSSTTILKTTTHINST